MRLPLAPWLRAVLLVALVGAMLWFAGHRLADDASSLDGAPSAGDVPLLALAIVLFGLATLCLGAAWIVLIEDIAAQGTRHRVRLMLAFVYAWLGRYVPGTVPFLAGKVYFGRRIGYSTRQVVVATGVQSVLEVLVCTTFGAVLVSASLGATAGMGLYVGLAVVPAFGLVMLHPPFLQSAIGRALRSLGRGPLPNEALPTSRAMLIAATLILCNQVLNGAALLLLLHVTASAGADNMLLAIGALSLAGVAGIVVVFAPAGIGVRDGALTALLATRIAVDAAALAAVMLRMLTVVADLVLVAIALAVDVVGGHGLALRAFRGGQDERRPLAAVAGTGAVTTETRSA